MQVSYIYYKAILRVTLRARYIQIGLRNMQNLMLSVLNPMTYWGGV